MINMTRYMPDTNFAWGHVGSSGVLGPPVKHRGGADQVWTALERDTVRGRRVLKVVNGGEVADSERDIGQRQRVLGWVRLGQAG